MVLLQQMERALEKVEVEVMVEEQQLLEQNLNRVVVVDLVIEFIMAIREVV